MDKTIDFSPVIELFTHDMMTPAIIFFVGFVIGLIFTWKKQLVIMLVTMSIYFTAIFTMMLRNKNINNKPIWAGKGIHVVKQKNKRAIGHFKTNFKYKSSKEESSPNSIKGMAEALTADTKKAMIEWNNKLENVENM